MQKHTQKSKNRKVQTMTDIGTTCAAAWEATKEMDITNPFVASGLTFMTCAVILNIGKILKSLKLFIEFTFLRVPTIVVPNQPPSRPDEDMDIVNVSLGPKDAPAGMVACYDKATFRRTANVVDMNAEMVNDLCAKAKIAQKSWVNSSYSKRRLVLRTLQKYILENIEDICELCAMESGKPLLDALLGEVLPTAEKIRTINQYGEEWLQPEPRVNTPMLFYKNAEVQYGKVLIG